MKKLNKNEEIARQNIIGAFNWIVGGYYNSLQDGDNQLPYTVADLKNEIYDSALNNSYLVEGTKKHDKAPKEMRFSGKKFIESVIEELCESDSDFNELVDCINSK